MASHTAPAGKRIVFTGGSGKAGRHVIPYLVSKNHKILNLDLQPLPSPLSNDVYTLKTDLTDPGQVFSALTSNFSLSSYANPRHSTTQPVTPVDAVIHFAAHARNLLVPDTECFKTNVLSTYNVLEAACKLGIPKVILASSETVYGVCFAQGDDVEYDRFPLSEDDYDCNPMDTYAMSKLCNERCGRSFNRRFPGTDVYALRIGNVIEPHEYDNQFREFVRRPETRKRNAWSYVDARDLGQICGLCLERGPKGFEVFNATNTSSTLKEPTLQFLERECPRTRVIRAMDEFEAPLSNRKVRDMLGFVEEHGWRRYLDL